VHISNISTIGINDPCISDHIGIIFDVDLASHFQSQYSDIAQPPHHILTSENKRSVDNHILHVNKQIECHKLWERVKELYDLAIQDPPSFSTEHSHMLNTIDKQLTKILHSADRSC
jgi:predicted GTPase